MLLENETIENKMFIKVEGNQQQLTINSMELSYYLPQRAIVEKEVTCNSTFMLANLLIIAAKIMKPCLGYRLNNQFYLVMDNAGGHGTQAAREEYMRRLRNEFNIIILQ
jgi:hypothetical protein